MNFLAILPRVISEVAPELSEFPESHASKTAKGEASYIVRVVAAPLTTWLLPVFPDVICVKKRVNIQFE
jgi:hypothetical protein